MEEQRKPGIWRPDPPASEAAIQKLLADCGLALPAAYLDHLRQSNGGEGDLAVQPCWVCFWSAEQIVEYNKDYEVAEYAPGFFGFGSNGGGELLAFKVSDSPDWPIYMIPFEIMEEEFAERVAENFQEFWALVGYEYEDDE